MGKVEQERKAEFVHFIFVFQGPSVLLSFMAGQGMHYLLTTKHLEKMLKSWYKDHFREIPGGPAVKTLCFYYRGAWVPSLVGEMRCLLHLVIWQKKKKKIISQWTSLQSHYPFLFLKKKALIEKCSVPNQSSGKLFCCCLVTKLLSDLL